MLSQLSLHGGMVDVYRLSREYPQLIGDILAWCCRQVLQAPATNATTATPATPIGHRTEGGGRNASDGGDGGDGGGEVRGEAQAQSTYAANAALLARARRAEEGLAKAQAHAVELEEHKRALEEARALAELARRQTAKAKGKASRLRQDMEHESAIVKRLSSHVEQLRPSSTAASSINQSINGRDGDGGETQTQMQAQAQTPSRAAIRRQQSTREAEDVKRALSVFSGDEEQGRSVERGGGGGFFSSMGVTTGDVHAGDHYHDELHTQEDVRGRTSI